MYAAHNRAVQKLPKVIGHLNSRFTAEVNRAKINVMIFNPNKIKDINKKNEPTIPPSLFIFGHMRYLTIELPHPGILDNLSITELSLFSFWANLLDSALFFCSSTFT